MNRFPHPYPQWALAVIEAYVCHHKKLDSFDDLPPDMQTRRAGCFVTLHTIDGLLRGCIGTIEPSGAHLAMEIRNNAISAATKDPRFPPVSCAEVPDLRISVDVLGQPEPIVDDRELDPRRYGIIVEHGVRKGLLLPDLEGVDRVSQQISIARMKAGIPEGVPLTIYRFSVERYLDFEQGGNE